MNYTPWGQVDVKLRDALDDVVKELKMAGAADPDIDSAVQRKLDEIEGDEA